MNSSVSRSAAWLIGPVGALGLEKQHHKSVYHWGDP